MTLLVKTFVVFSNCYLHAEAGESVHSTWECAYKEWSLGWEQCVHLHYK